MPFGISAGTAAIIGGGLSAAGAIGSAAIQSGNVGKAGRQSAFNQLLATQQAQQTFNTSTGQIQDAVKQGQGYVAPYYAAGTPAIGQEGALLGLQGQDAANQAMSTFQQSPGYQWQLGQGLRAIDAGAAAGVRQPGVRSGATIKAEETYGQGLAQQDFSNYFTRLNALAGMGQTAATSEANLGTGGAGQLVNAGANLQAGITGQTNASTASAVGAANAQNSILGNTASGLGTTVNSLFSNPDVRATLGIGQPSPATNTTFSGYAPALTPGQVGVGGFVAPTQPTY